MKNLIITLLTVLIMGAGGLHAQDNSKDKKDKMDMDHSEKAMHMDHKDKSDNQKQGMVNNIIKDWPEPTKKAAETTIKAYGNPDGMSERELIWHDAGIWEVIRLSKEETNHDFPVAHTDYLQQTIYHNVPTEKMSDLGEFDGSVTFSRTQGQLSARCDMEANNFLALNLAHDIIMGNKSVEEARKAYGDIIKQKMNGEDPEYMKKLQFEPMAQDASADSDTNTTGLTKKEVMEAIKKNSQM